MPESKETPSLWNPDGSAVQKTTVVDESAVAAPTSTPQPPAADPPAANPPPAADPPAVSDADKKALQSLEERDRRAFERETNIKAQQTQLDEYAALKESIKTDPHAAFTALGGDTMKLAEGFLTTEPPAPATPEMQALQDQLKGAMDKIGELTTNQEAYATQSHKNNQVRDIKAIARGNPELEFVQMYSEGHPDVFDGIYEDAKRQWEKDGIRPNFATLLNQAETMLMDNTFEELTKLKTMPKFQEKLQELLAATGDQKATTASISTPKPPSQTLTNNMTSTPAVTNEAPVKSIEEAVQRASKFKLWE